MSFRHQDEKFCHCVSETGISLKRLAFSNFWKWTDDVSGHQLQKLGDNRPYLKDIFALIVVRGSSNFHFIGNFNDSTLQAFNFCEEFVRSNSPPKQNNTKRHFDSKKSAKTLDQSTGQQRQNTMLCISRNDIFNYHVLLYSVTQKMVITKSRITSENLFTSTKLQPHQVNSMQQTSPKFQVCATTTLYFTGLPK